MSQKYAGYNAAGTITGFYDSVASPVPANVTAIEITAAQYAAALASQKYTVSGTPPALVAPAA